MDKEIILNKQVKALELIEKINWSDFKQQRLGLLNAMETLAQDANEAGSVGEETLVAKYNQQIEALQGIVELCDHLVDFGIDVLGLDENKICLREEV